MRGRGLPPDFVLPAFCNVIGVLGIGVLNPGNEADYANQVKAEEVY
jgi:hypothetical protein